MLAFVVKKGTRCRILRKGSRFIESDYVTARDNIFYRENIRIDPQGRLGAYQSGKFETHDGSHGAQYYQNLHFLKVGYYGFVHDPRNAMPGVEGNNFDILFVNPNDIKIG